MDLAREAFKNDDYAGASREIDLAIKALPKDAPNIRGDLHFTDSIERMERAYDDWKSGHFSRDPFQDILSFRLSPHKDYLFVRGGNPCYPL
jgi:hypothetical protein